MHGFVVRIALRQHAPLRASVENPQDCFEHARRRNRFASRTTIRNVFLRKMIPNALPMLVAEPNCQRQSKNASAGRSKNTSVLLAGRPPKLGSFVRASSFGRIIYRRIRASTV